ncbi:MAG: hypothetical protein K9L68_06140 [Spirochaetales bacterium]|nr:hypothetical protein [Spirochaetales bacterium]MCF7938162.1 hypothetical protein [Spirochaetales bacterium]
MKFDELVEIASGMPCFSPRFLFAGEKPDQVRLQIHRWVADGRVIRIHKGLYTLAEPYRTIPLEQVYIAQKLRRASYLSLQSALSWYGMIPEYVPVTTMVTTGRPQSIDTPVGSFLFRHIKPEYFGGFRMKQLDSGNEAAIASPEKALLDLVYITPGGDDPDYLRELRLQNLDRVNVDQLKIEAKRFGRPKIERAYLLVCDLINKEKEVFRQLLNV